MFNRYDEVTTARGEGAARTTWVGTVRVGRTDGTTWVDWHTPMTAKSIDFPTADLTKTTREALSRRNRLRFSGDAD